MGRDRKWASTFAAIVFLAAIAILLVRCGTEAEDREEIAVDPPVDESAEASSPSGEGESEPGAELSPARFTAHILRFDGDELTLVESREIDGRAKTPRSVSRAGNLYFRIVDADGGLLWETAMRDPRLLYYDSVDEEGELVGGQTRLATVDFVLRVPQRAGAVALEVIDYTRPEAPVDLGRFPL